MNFDKLAKWIYLVLIFIILFTLNGCKKDLVISPPIEEYFPTDAFPSWSPDGRWIAYYHDNYSYVDIIYPNGLYIIDTGGNNRKLLVPGFATAPDWSPDGRWIVFSTGAICIMSPNSDTFKNIVSPGLFPTWSPDNKKIAYGRSGTQDTVGIWIINTDSLIARRFDYGGAPDWSPNGQQFVYAGSPDAYTLPQVFIVDILNPANKVKLTNNGKNNVYPKWSPNGNLIVWCIQYPGSGEVWLMNHDGTNQRKFVNGQHPSFSPDSRRIVFTDWNYGMTKNVLWTINFDRSGKRQLTY